MSLESIAPWQVAVLSVYGGLLILLSTFAVHRIRLAWAGRRVVREPSAVPALAMGRWPTVTVQLPIYNERYVAARLVEAACAMRYPRERLTIQVLDDSTDDTRAIVAAVVARLRQDGHPVEHVTRSDRSGYKAGALAAGMERSSAELFAIFDADFVPTVDFLERMVPNFVEPDIGMVQACWGHLNREASVLTQAQSILLDGHFLNEHTGRSARGVFFNFNGTAGVWRRRAIEDAGGWLSRTITEDLDLSYRAQLAGWRFCFRPDVVVPAEVPPTGDAFKSQQHRWAKGSIETARYLLPQIWRAPQLGWRQRVEASFHLLGNLAYPLVIGMALMLPAVVLARPEEVSWLVHLVDASLLLGASGSVIGFYLVAVLRAGRRDALWYMPAALAIGVGLAVNNTRALLEAVLGRRSGFVRTPKYGDADRGEVDRRYLDGLGAIVPAVQIGLEIALGLCAASAMALAIDTGQYLTVPFLGLFAWGFLQLGLGSAWRALPARVWNRLGGKVDAATVAKET